MRWMVLVVGLSLGGCLGSDGAKKSTKADPPTSPDMGLTRSKLTQSGWSVVQIKQVAKQRDHIYITITGKWAGRYWREDGIRVLADGKIDPIHEGLSIGPHWAIRRGTTLTVIDVRGNLMTYIALK